MFYDHSKEMRSLTIQTAQFYTALINPRTKAMGWEYYFIAARQRQREDRRTKRANGALYTSKINKK